MAHVHSISDADAHFSVDTIRRVIRNKAPMKTRVAQYDHNSERFTFELPRYVEGHDMSKCNVVEVHYNNGGNRGRYTVEDLEVSTEDANKIVCSWLISRNATQKAGLLEFRLTFKCVSGEETEYAWSTEVHKSITVTAGIDTSGAIEEAYPDVISQLIGKVDALGKGGVATGGTNSRIGYVTILSANWVLVDEDRYAQVVSVDVESGDGVTENSQVDLTPSDEQLAIWREKDLALTTENYGGEVTVYAVGQKPENDYTIQVTLTEVA